MTITPKALTFYPYPIEPRGGDGGGVRVSARIRTYAETAKAISRALRRVRYGSATRYAVTVALSVPVGGLL